MYIKKYPSLKKKKYSPSATIHISFGHNLDPYSSKHNVNYFPSQLCFFYVNLSNAWCHRNHLGAPYFFHGPFFLLMSWEYNDAKKNMLDHLNCCFLVPINLHRRLLKITWFSRWNAVKPSIIPHSIVEISCVFLNWHCRLKKSNNQKLLTCSWI